MGWKEWIPIMTSVVGVIVAIVTMRYIRKANKLIELQLESQIRTRIDEARKNLTTTIFNLSGDRKDKILIKLKEVAIEGYLNAFDYACQKYLNEELNKKNFKEMYVHEMKKICTSGSYSSKIQKPDYIAIRKVGEEMGGGDCG